MGDMMMNQFNSCMKRQRHSFLNVLIGIVIAVVGLAIVLFVMNAYLYRQASYDLTKAFRTIIAHDPAAAVQAAPEADEPQGYQEVRP